jgi:hypothetical protein
MYENPWKLSVGDLVTTADTYSCTAWTGVITERRRKYMYVEARPIRNIEIDEYCIVIDELKRWIPADELELCQEGLSEDRESTVLSSRVAHE